MLIYHENVSFHMQATILKYNIVSENSYIHVFFAFTTIYGKVTKTVIIMAVSYKTLSIY